MNSRPSMPASPREPESAVVAPPTKHGVEGTSIASATATRGFASLQPAPSRHDQAETLRKRVRPRRDPKRAPILAITSGKGGVGKTVISVNLALRLAQSGKRVLLIDLDPGLANVDVHLRLHAERCVDDVLQGHCEAEDAILVGPAGLWIMPGGSLSTRPNSAPHEPRDRLGPTRLIERLERVLPSIDLVILDTGAGVGPWVEGALELADKTIVVTQSDPASVTDAYALIKLGARLRPDSQPSLTINRVQNREEALRTATRLRKVTQRFLGFEPELLGWLHDHASVTKSVQQQRPFALEMSPDHRAMRDLVTLAARASAVV